VQAGATAGLALWSDGRQVLPALGLAWSSCVGQRLFLARTGRPDGAGGTLRQLRVVYSPFLPQVTPGCVTPDHLVPLCGTAGTWGTLALQQSTYSENCKLHKLAAKWEPRCCGAAGLLLLGGEEWHPGRAQPGRAEAGRGSGQHACRCNGCRAA
jgi:hypothetical protein